MAAELTCSSIAQIHKELTKMIVRGILSGLLTLAIVFWVHALPLSSAV